MRGGHNREVFGMASIYNMTSAVVWLSAVLSLLPLEFQRCHGARTVDVEGRFRRNLDLILHSVEQGSLQQSHSQTRTLLQLQYQEHLDLLQAVAISHGLQKLKFQETYDGIPVVGYGVVVETKNGFYTGDITGDLVEGIWEDLGTARPFLSVREALAIAMSIHHDDPDDITFYADEDAQLEIHISDKMRSGVLPILVYRISYTVFTYSRQARPYSIINAQTGDILRAWDGLTTRSMLSSRSVYAYHGVGGNLAVGLHVFGGDLPALDVFREADMCYLESENVRVVDNKFHMHGNATFSFLCENGTNDTINGGFSPAADAFFFSDVAHAVFMDWAGVPPLKFQIEAHVHFLTHMENAFWDGRGMYFGDGFTRYHPLPVLDIVAHELAHGFTEQQSGLLYYGQSGAVNEAFSDITGVAAEDFILTTDWYQGAGVVKETIEMPYRNLQNPPADGHSIAHFEDYCPGMDVHFASGIVNKAFYILTRKDSWSIQKAFQAFALANRLYWKPSSTITEAACGVARAAADLGLDKNDIFAAFDEVGITPCHESPSGIHLSSSLNFQANSTKQLLFKLNFRCPLLKFEVLQGWFKRGVLRVTVTPPSGLERRSRSNSSQLLLEFPDSEPGYYHMTLEALSATSDIDVYAISSENIIQDGVDLDERGRAIGHFTLPLSVVLLGNPIVLRLNNKLGLAPVMFLNYDSPVNFTTRAVQTRTHFQKDNDDFIFTEVYLCQPGFHVYHYSLQGIANHTGITISYLELLMPWYHRDD